MRLQFRSDGTFTIAQFTDLHWNNGEPADLKTGRLMEAVLEWERPDFVILTGDILSGRACRDPAASWRDAVRPLDARATPWAAVFGNHDDEGSCTRTDLMAVQRSSPFCLSEPGPAAVPGVGNYRLLVHAGDTPRLALYCVDSRSYATTGIGGYGWIEAGQVNWYRAVSAALAQACGSPLPALAFLHIPLPEYNEVWDQHTCWGTKQEAVCCPRINTGFFAALHETGEVMGVFAGHDHVNDYVGDLHGIRLAYGRVTGYQTYGKEGMARGARLIRVTANEPGFATWLRLDGGERLDEQPEHSPIGT